ncbi:MAG: OmpA family protein, partial [Nitrospira defluvii]|nr:OmpA family protein [Nitrospira defluvii]
VETGLVTIDAEAMGKDIDQYGKVALYGLYFDHDKAVLKPESKPALVEIATLLKARPTLNVYVVGHTDSTGTFAYNLKLSADRARAIVGALVKNYGIASARLEPHGVASLAPVVTNQSDGGRAKNRRVELVAR